MNDNPLVSVVVLTYNSSKTVLETLNSIAAQTYKNIELIISDDCSKDDTLKKCKKWELKNKQRFTQIIIIRSNQNTGTAANGNRGANAANGEWLKFIAADDVLLPNCVHSNIDYILTREDVGLVFSKVVPFGNRGIIKEKYRTLEKGYSCMKLNFKDFYILIRIGNFLPASSSFIKKRLFDSLCGFDESIPLLEDWPFWIKAAYNKEHFHFIPIETVKYRMEESSVSLGERSQNYKNCEIRAQEYALYIQRKTNKFLWLYSICNYKHFVWYLKILCLLCLFINPMTYYIKYIEYKVNRFR